MLKYALLGGAAALALASASAKAADTAIIIWNAADAGGFESAVGTGSASILGSNLDGVTISVSSVKKGINPNDLTEANINIDNTTGVSQTLRIIAGANGYLGPATGFSLTGAIGVTLGSADLTGDYFVDAANGLNGQGFSIAGLNIGGFDSLSLSGPHSFAFNGFGADLVNGPYGLAESLTLTLAPGASVFVQGVSMDATNAIPEASTWAMGVLGFGLLGLVGFHKRKGERVLAA